MKTHTIPIALAMEARDWADKLEIDPLTELNRFMKGVDEGYDHGWPGTSTQEDWAHLLIVDRPYGLGWKVAGLLWMKTHPSSDTRSVEQWLLDVSTPAKKDNAS